MIPRASAEFVCMMEEVLEVYSRPYTPDHPVVCLDESPYQLLEHPRESYINEQGILRQDYEYIRKGVVDLYMITEPLGARREVLVKDNHTSATYAQVLAHIAEEMYPDQRRITLVEDNLSAHRMAALYEVFQPSRAREIARKFEVIRTPPHGSWLNIAECELSVLKRVGLKERIADKESVIREVEAWYTKRNRQQKGVDWQFTAEEARIKLKKLYPSICS